MATSTNDKVDKLFAAGAHYGYSRSRRHPSVKSFIFGTKNTVEIFDLEKTEEALDAAKAFMKDLGSLKKSVLFVSGKNEAKAAIERASEKLSMPSVSGRWIGGTLTNFDEVKKRTARLNDLQTGREKGAHEKYTKHERLLIDREIRELTDRFGGIASMEKVPACIVVIDPKQEAIAVAEARVLGIPIVALASSDCNLSEIDYPIPANDANIDSITLVLGELVDAYGDGLKNPKVDKKVDPKAESKDPLQAKKKTVLPKADEPRSDKSESEEKK